MGWQLSAFPRNGMQKNRQVVNWNYKHILFIIFLSELNNVTHEVKDLMHCTVKCSKHKPVKDTEKGDLNQ